MVTLLTEFGITKFIVFIITTAVAIEGLVKFFDWATQRMAEKVHRDDRPDKIEAQLEQIEATHCQHIENLKKKDEELQGELNSLTQKIDILIDSDKDDIKAWITEQYYKFKDQGSIDSYSLDCIEHRYTHYKQEDGNSFVEKLMNEIRNLPMK